MSLTPKNATRLGLGTFPKAGPSLASSKPADPKPPGRVKLTNAQQAELYLSRKRRHPRTP